MKKCFWYILFIIQFWKEARTRSLINKSLIAFRKKGNAHIVLSFVRPELTDYLDKLTMFENCKRAKSAEESYELLLKVIEWWRKLQTTFFFFFFFWATLFLNKPQCCLTSSWIGLQMLLGCSLIHISIIIVRHFLYVLYLCPCLDLGLLMSYLCDLFFIFIFIFIIINCIISWIQTPLFFCLFYRPCPIIIRMKNVNNFPISKTSASGRC